LCHVNLLGLILSEVEVKVPEGSSMSQASRFVIK